MPLARALVAGGVAIIEVTLRTPRALDAVAAIAAEVPEIALGVGSVLTADHVDQALAAGADFLVSPGRARPCWSGSSPRRYRCCRGWPP